MEALILAGGLGTRLRSITKNLPKAMVDINGIPFMQILLDFLSMQGINKTILCVGYKKEFIIKYFKNKYKNIDIRYSLEDTPLGTGGAIKKALHLCKNDDVFILNGDSFFDIDYKRFLLFHKEKNAALSIASKQIQNSNRYGNLIIDKQGKVLDFREKKFFQNALINGGVYILKRKDFSNNMNKNNFSFEDFLQANVLNIDIYACKFDTYFIDIGIEEDYKKFKKDNMTSHKI